MTSLFWELPFRFDSVSIQSFTSGGSLTISPARFSGLLNFSSTNLVSR
ncbi:hypothetical protein [Xanthobacter sp. NFM-89]|nr:hypothetical protein [Xanthobacter sp. NFM-89]